MPKIAPVLAAILALATSGCHVFQNVYAMMVYPGGEIEGKAATIEHCEKWVTPPRHLLYSGSDKQWHYFISRPVDDFAFYKISREELEMADERPFAGDYLPAAYAVDFRNGFKKLD